MILFLLPGIALLLVRAFALCDPVILNGPPFASGLFRLLAQQIN